MVTLDDLKHACQEGESNTLEFKQDLTKEVLNALSTRLAAFANTEGGAIIIGVNDEKEPVGYTPSPRHEDRNRISVEAKNCSPPVQVGFDQLKFGRLHFLVIKVAKSDALHCDKAKKFPIRVGSIVDYLDSAGVVAKLQGMQGGFPQGPNGEWLGAHTTPSRITEGASDFEPRRRRKPTSADVRLILKALGSADLSVQSEGLEQLRRFSWDFLGWYNKRLFPHLRDILRSKDEGRTLTVLQILRPSVDPEGRKSRAVMDYFRGDLVQLCHAGPTTQVRMNALEVLKEARDPKVVDMVLNWATSLDDAAFKELQPPYIFTNMSSYGYFDRARQRLMTELTSKRSRVSKSRLLELLKGLREHGR